MYLRVTRLLEQFYFYFKKLIFLMMWWAPVFRAARVKAPWMNFLKKFKTKEEVFWEDKPNVKCFLYTVVFCWLYCLLVPINDTISLFFSVMGCRQQRVLQFLTFGKTYFCNAFVERQFGSLRFTFQCKYWSL